MSFSEAIFPSVSLFRKGAVSLYSDSGPHACTLLLLSWTYRSHWRSRGFGVFTAAMENLREQKPHSIQYMLQKRTFTQNSCFLYTVFGVSWGYCAGLFCHSALCCAFPKEEGLAFCFHNLSSGSKQKNIILLNIHSSIKGVL